MLKGKIGLVSFEALALSLVATPVLAQSEAAGSAPATVQGPVQADVRQNVPDTGDIIVTARRRSETTLQTPVVLTAFSSEQLRRFQVNNVGDVAKLTPSLAIAPASGSYGGLLVLRGVSSPSSNAAAEPAVTINIDGIPVSYGSIVRLSTFDIGQVEVLKGPQALFFGKNSSGGIISIRSAEPTREFKAEISGAYEFKARQVDLEGYVSGTVSDTISMRLAGRFSRQRGYFKNIAPVPAFDYGPGTDEEAVRLSVNFEPTDRLTVKLRGTYHHVHENGGYSTGQKIFCATPGQPAGGGVIPGVASCGIGNTVAIGAIPSAAIRALTGNPFWDSDKAYFKAKQYLLSADIQYELTDFITLNSLTGYYDINQKALDSSTSGGRFFFSDQGRVQKHTFSQEVRLSYNNPDTPMNLMIGGFYLDDSIDIQQSVVGNLGTGFPVGTLVSIAPSWVFPITGRTLSAFGQADWDITSAFSLSVGVRYTQDRKTNYLTPPSIFLVNKFNRPVRTFNNWSPEMTLSYKPNAKLNIFGSYKQGFKAGSYNAASTAYGAALNNSAITSIDNSYAPETVKGFEIGVKTLLLENQLRLNLAAYSYLYEDLQLSRIDPSTAALTIVNASSARVKGLEGDFNFSPSAVQGWSIFGAAAYNSAKYASSFLGSCYVGQTPAGGCIVDGPDADVIPDLQEFKGRPLPRAPKFSASLGTSYEASIGDDWTATFSANGIYTSSNFVSQELAPFGKTPARTLFDASLTFGPKSKAYEFAIFGRNLTDKHFLVTGYQSILTGSGTGTAAGRLADYEGFVSRGREIWLKLTIRPSEF